MEFGEPPVELSYNPYHLPCSVPKEYNTIVNKYHPRMLGSEEGIEVSQMIEVLSLGKHDLLYS